MFACACMPPPHWNKSVAFVWYAIEFPRGQCGLAFEVGFYTYSFIFSITHLPFGKMLPNCTKQIQLCIVEPAEKGDSRCNGVGGNANGIMVVIFAATLHTRMFSCVRASAEAGRRSPTHCGLCDFCICGQDKI